MKRIYRYIYSLMAFMAAMLLSGGCMDHLSGTDYNPTERVSFKASLGAQGDALSTKGMVGSLSWEEEDWVLDADAATKATLYNTLNDAEDAGVYGYIYNGAWGETVEPLTGLVDGQKYNFDGDELNAESPVRWKVIEDGVADGSKFRALVYAPKGAVTPSLEVPAEGVNPATGAPVISIDNVLAHQKDIIVAEKETVINSETKAHRNITLEFEHIFTAIEFKKGFECTITGISISGPLVIGGDYVVGEGWKKENSKKSSSTIDLDLSEETILMMPQEMSLDDEEIKLTVKYKEEDSDEDQFLSAKLNGIEWKQGKKITYTLKKGNKQYVYLDLAAGDIIITGKHYVGYVFDGNGDPYKLDDYLEEYQEYYVYQSNTQKYGGDKNQYKDSNYRINNSNESVVTLPSYPPVEYNDQLWSEYIVNNTDTQAIIAAWDNAAGAGQATASDAKAKAPNGTKAAGAVRNAGREATKNRIHITGNIGSGRTDNTVRLTIDNIYSSYQQRGSTPVRNRTEGGISFLPEQDNSSNSILVINIVGDNRLGCVHYQNWRNDKLNWLKFEGSGSLTVGDTDYYSDGTYGSNRSCSVIGGQDQAQSSSDKSKLKEDVYNIEFNSGVIYAGAGTSACTAIGGGGNGDTNIIINGGTITAVTSSTGTAIGGGSGLQQPGGIGNVTITGGNVYAYNFGNKTTPPIPSAAIGAAGSRDAKGGNCKIDISGGYVYAYAAKGTAIGGGSSAEEIAGTGTINIRGGTVIAKTGVNTSVGIGGGCAFTNMSGSSKQGGAAVITITGDPVIRTGSIGGGTAGSDSEGKIGSATINISGGDIQAQFVLADSDGNTFNMSGGLIRNVNTSDSEYYCVQPNGGAVYMEKGSFTMSDDAVIRRTSSVKGGAVYIKGGDFTMTGGTIEECKADTDGGAVYLEGGSVTINGGTVQGNVAYNGNGGAISVLGGDFTMTGGAIQENAAFNKDNGTKGNGGGIYVAPAQGSSSDISVSLEKGTIKYNSSDRYGGGVCVDMSGNDSADLTVTVGKGIVNPATTNMSITENNSLVKGGGLYVRGAKAQVTLNDGYVSKNQTSPYEPNPDITVDDGLVKLNNEGITTQVTVVFNDNRNYLTQGKEKDQTVTQFLVTAALSNHVAPFPADYKINDYYDDFTGWNTKRDGTGITLEDADKNKDGFQVSYKESIEWFAQWK